MVICIGILYSIELFKDWEMEALHSCLGLLYSSKIIWDRTNHMFGNPTKRGVFAVKSYCRALSPTNTPEFSLEKYLEGDSRFKSGIFLVDSSQRAYPYYG